MADELVTLIEALNSTLNDIDASRKRGDFSNQEKYNQFLADLLQLQQLVRTEPFTSQLNIAILGNIIEAMGGVKRSSEIINLSISRFDDLPMTTGNVLSQAYDLYNSSLMKIQDQFQRAATISAEANVTVTPSTNQKSYGAEADAIIQKLDPIIVENEDIRIGLDDIVGNDDLKTMIRTWLRNALDSKPIIFYGAPGSGKNTMVNAIAKALGKDVILIAVSSLLSQFQGESEKRVKMAIDLADLIGNEVIVCMDEAESLLLDRTQQSTLASGRTIVQTFLTLLENMTNKRALVFTTNYIRRVDNAIRRRLYEIPVRYPEASDAAKIFKQLLSRYNVSDIDSYNIEDFSRVLSPLFLSPANMVDIIMLAFGRQGETIKTVSCGRDTYAALLSEPVFNVCVYDNQGDTSVDSIPYSVPIYPGAISVQEVYQLLREQPVNLTLEEYRSYYLPNNAS